MEQYRKNRARAMKAWAVVSALLHLYGLFVLVFIVRPARPGASTLRLLPRMFSSSAP